MNLKDVAALARDRLPGVRNRQSRAEYDPGLVPPGRAGEPAAKPEIPVPPYDRELPQDYWQKLHLSPTKEKSPVAHARARRSWLLTSCLVACTGWALWSITAKSLRQAEFPPPHLDHLVPNPEPAAPRAQLFNPEVRRALPVVAPSGMVAGQSYRVQMPPSDGRLIVINFKGMVPDFRHLPLQHGVTNAAYTDASSGITWIWTVPAGASNVAQWIDP